MNEPTVDPRKLARLDDGDWTVLHKAANDFRTVTVQGTRYRLIASDSQPVGGGQSERHCQLVEHDHGDLDQEAQRIVAEILA